VSLDRFDSELSLGSVDREDLTRELRTIRAELDGPNGEEGAPDRECLKTVLRWILYEVELAAEQEREEVDQPALPIQRIARFSGPMAREHLTPTHQRARFIWSRYEEISREVRGGRVIEAGQLKKHLQAREDEEAEIYAATVGRVLEAIVELTHGIAEVTKSEQGERQLYIPDDWKQQAEEHGGQL
jgi:hypothetical protein